MDWGVTLYGLQAHEVEGLWPVFWGLLSKANDFDPSAQIEERATKEALKEGKVVGLYAIREGEMRMALTLERKETSRGLIADITAIGGVGMEDWLAGIDSIATWAKDVGCSYLQASGRSGWERVLKGNGFRKVSVTVEKAL